MNTHSAVVREILGMDASDTFSCVTIGIAAPETIRSWSRGEVKIGRHLTQLVHGFTGP